MLPVTLIRGSEGDLLSCCWTHQPRGAVEMAEMGKLWQKLEDVTGHSRQHRRNFSAWAEVTACAISPDFP